MLFKRGDSTSENNSHRGLFPSSERNRSISVRSSLLPYLIKPINYGYQAIIFHLQSSVFASFYFRLQAPLTGSSAITIAKPS